MIPSLSNWIVFPRRCPIRLLNACQNELFALVYSAPYAPGMLKPIEDEGYKVVLVRAPKDQKWVRMFA
jgi:hypothetical protein